ncbi:MAG: regulatory protein RecX [Gammaproteobacteria bacterium]
MLARREHSRQELQQKLTVRGYADSEITAVLDELANAGLQSDTRYAEAYVNQRTEKGYGPLYIIQALRSRGVDAAVTDQFLDLNDPDWSRRAADVLARRFGVVDRRDRKAYARALRFMQQRGFSAAHVRHALDDDFYEE